MTQCLLYTNILIIITIICIMVENKNYLFTHTNIESYNVYTIYT